MTKTEQMKLVLWGVRAVFFIAIISLVVLISIAMGADAATEKSAGHLSDTAMWILGIIGTAFFSGALVLRKHENDIIKLQAEPDSVTKDMCLGNILLINSELSHGQVRFIKIEKALEEKEVADKTRHTEAMARHTEMMAALGDLKN